MENKHEAIDFFAFMKKIHKSAISNIDAELQGVFFHDKYAYSTNGHLIGRISIDDSSPIKCPIFCKYDEEYSELDDKQKKIINETFFQNSLVFFKKEYENCFFFKRDRLISLIEELYGEKEATKIKTFVEIRVDQEYNISLNFLPVKPTPKNQPQSKIMQMFFNPSKAHIMKISNSSCVVSVFYIHSILKNSFKDGSVVGIKYNQSRSTPIILFNKRENIYWAITQKI